MNDGPEFGGTVYTLMNSVVVLTLENKVLDKHISAQIVSYRVFIDIV